MEKSSVEVLKYPIGRFEKPISLDSTIRKEYIKFIRKYPDLISEIVRDFTKKQLDTPYRPEGWTIRQLLHHIPESHMNAYIRFKWALTEEEPVIKAYDEAAWAGLPYIAANGIAEPLALLSSLHRSWATLMEHMNEQDWNRILIHPQHQTQFQLWEMLAMYHWHSRHHLAHITNLIDREGWK